MRLVVLGILPATLNGYAALTSHPNGEIGGADGLVVVPQSNPLFRPTTMPMSVGMALPASGPSADGTAQPEMRVELPSLPNQLQFVGGLRVPSRVTALEFDSRTAPNGGKRWLQLPGTCEPEASAIESLTTYSNGVVDSDRRTPTIAPCDGMVLRPSVTLSTAELGAGRDTGFDFSLEIPDPAPGERLAAPQIPGIRLPGWSGVMALMSTLPACDPPTAAAGGCDAEARLGNICLLSGPSRTRVCGEAWNNTPRSAAGCDPCEGKIIFVVKKGMAPDPNSDGSGDIIATFPGVLADAPDGSGAVLRIDGLPQLDPREWRISIDKPVLRNPNRCASRNIEGTVSAWNGASVSVSAPPIETTNCPTTITSPADGSFVGTNDLPVEFTSTDDDTICSIDGTPKTPCVSGWRTGPLTEGPHVVEVQGQRCDDATCVARARFTVDTVAPAIAVNEEGIEYTADSFFDVFADFTDANLAEIRCHLAGSGNDPNAGCGDTVCSTEPDISCGDSVCLVNGDPDRPIIAHFSCRLEDLAEGPHQIVLTATDKAGNTNTRVIDIVVDLTPPRIHGLPTGVQYTTESFFDVVIEIEELNLGGDWWWGHCDAASTSSLCAADACTALGDLDGDGHAEFRCRVEGLTEGLNEIEIVATDRARNSLSSSFKVVYDSAAPSVTTPDPRDEFCDGGVKDAIPDCDRPASFSIPFTATDTGSGVDWSTAACRGRGIIKTKPSDISRSSGRIVDTDTDGVPDACQMENLEEGSWEVEIEVGDHAGNVKKHTILYEVDITEPEIALGEEGVQITGDPDFDLVAIFRDRNLASITCSLKGDTTEPDRACGDALCSTDPNATCGDRVTCRIDEPDQLCGDSLCRFVLDGTVSQDDGEIKSYTFSCRLPGLSEGLHHVVLTAQDWAGNSSQRVVDILVDLTQPTLATIDPRDIDDNGDGYADHRFRPAFFDIEYRMDDFGSGIDPTGIECVTITNEGRDREGVAPASQTTGQFTCPLTDLPEGDVEVEASVADLAGHRTVLKSKFTVDTTEPAVSFFDPGSEPFVPHWPWLQFDVLDANPGSTSCTLTDEVTGAVVHQDDDCDGYRTGPDDADACDPNDPSTAGDCKRTFVIPHVLEKSGSYRATVTHTDAAGNSGSASLPFIVDNEAPEIAIGEEGVQYTAESFFDIAAAITDANLAEVHCQIVGSGSDPNAGCGDNLCGSDPNAGCGDTVCGTEPDVGCGDSVCRLSRDELRNENWNFGCRVSELPDGWHQFLLTATDRAGNSNSKMLDVLVATSPPTVSFDPTPPPVTNDARPAFGAVCGSGICTVELRVDDQEPVRVECYRFRERSCTRTIEPRTALTDGTRRICLIASDPFERQGDGICVDMEVDTHPPEQVIIEWSPSLDDGTGENDVIGYAIVRGFEAGGFSRKCYVDDAELPSCDDGEPIDLGAPGVHTIRVVETDAAGNIQTTVRTIGSTPPRLTIEAPTVGSFTSNKRPIYRFRIADSYDPGEINGPFNSRCELTAPDQSRVWETDCVDGSNAELPSLDDGPYKFTVRTRDVFGNTTIRSADFTVDTTQPEIEIVAPTGHYFKTPPPVTFRFVDQNPHLTHYVLSSLVDGQVIEDGDCDDDDPTGGPCQWVRNPYSEDLLRSFNWGQLQIPPGAYRVEVYGIDRAGNRNSTTFDFTVGNDPPVLALPFTGVQYVNENSFAWDTEVDLGPNASGGALVRCGVATGAGAAAGAAAMCGGPGGDDDCDGAAMRFACVADNLAEGLNHITMTATDEAGNTGTVAFDVVVDTTAPSVSAPRAPVNVNTAGAVFPFTVEEANPVAVRCEFLPEVGDEVLVVFESCGGGSGGGSGGQMSCTDGVCQLEVSPGIPLPDGAYRLHIVATDAANNTEELTHSFTVDNDVPPQIAISSPARDMHYASDTVPLSFQVIDDDLGASECSIDGGDFGTCPPIIGPLNPGEHVLTIRYFDSLGNAFSATVRFWVDDDGGTQYPPNPCEEGMVCLPPDPGYM